MALCGLAIAEGKMEEVLHPPIREQRAVWTEQNTVGAIDVAHPDRQLGCFQHAAHLREKYSLNMHVFKTQYILTQTAVWSEIVSRDLDPDHD